MLGLSRAEVWVLKALPWLLLAMASTLLLTKAAWSVLTPGDFACFTPMSLTSEQASYANRYCEKSDNWIGRVTGTGSDRVLMKKSSGAQAPNMAAVNTIFLLLSLALLCCVPLAVGDLLRRVVASTRQASYKDVSVVVTIVRATIILLNRLVAGIFLIIAAAFVKRFEQSQPENVPMITSLGFLNANVSSVLKQRGGMIAMCDLEIRKLGKNYVHALTCDVTYGPHVLMSAIFVFFTWITVTASLVWIIANGINTLVLLIIPSSRKFQLAIEDEVSKEFNSPEQAEDVKMSRFD